MRTVGVVGAGVSKKVMEALAKLTAEERQQLLFGDWAACQDVPKPKHREFRSEYIQAPASKGTVSHDGYTGGALRNRREPLTERRLQNMAMTRERDRMVKADDRRAHEGADI